VTAKNFDFFKAEPVTKYKPAIFDDGLLQKQSADVLKAFLFPTEEDCTLWARYGSSTFDQSASRQACNNPICKTSVKNAIEKAQHAAPFELFLDIIKPSFKAITDEEDLLAILARTHVVVISDETVFWRFASEDKNPVPFRLWPKNVKPDLFSLEAKPAMKAYKENPNARVYCADFQEKREWSQVFLQKCIYGEEMPKILSVTGPSLLDPEPKTSYRFPTLKRMLEYGSKNVAVSPPQKKLKTQELADLALAEHASRVDAGMSAGSRAPGVPEELSDEDIEKMEADATDDPANCVLDVFNDEEDVCGFWADGFDD
jgi:hypothetical protein